MPTYLFQFGFETPAMIESNLKWGSDFEDSHAVFIEATNQCQALEIGRAIANDFFMRMWHGQTPSTTVDDYAHWIEENPETDEAWESLANIVTLNSGDTEPARSLVDRWLAEIAK